MGPTGSGDGEAVVVPAIAPPSSLACLRSLGRRGIRGIGVSERETAAAFASKYCDESRLVPSPAGDGYDAYAEALLALAEREEVRTVLPVREEDAYVLARRRAEFGRHVGTPWPDWETLRRVQDRLELYDVAASVGVAVPETELLSQCDDWDRELIVKSRYTLPADAFGPFDSGRSSAASWRTRYVQPGERPPEVAIRVEMGHDPLVQAFMPGPDEYGFFALYDDGEALATFQHRQVRGYKYAGGPSAFRESVDIPAMESAGTRLLDALGWHGVAMVEFKRDFETGEFQLMEVNPRFWSSLPFTVQAGADLPYYAWLLAAGEADGIEPGYEVGVAGHLIRGELLYLHSVLREEYPLVERPTFPRALRAVVASLVRHPRFDYLARDDPRPFVRDLRNFVADVRRPDRDRLAASVGDGIPPGDGPGPVDGTAEGTAAEGMFRGRID